LARDEGGTVAIIVALMMLIVFGAAGFAFDFGRFYLTQNRDQMAADAAAFSAALAYGGTSSSSTAATQACVTAVQNGVSVTCPGGTGTTASVTTTIGPSPTNASLMAAHVVVHSTMQLSAFGALVQRSGNSLPVNAGAWAMINPGAAPCLIALSPASVTNPPAVSLQGSASINAMNCAVEAGGPVSLTGGTSLKAQAIFSGDAISATNGTTLVGTQHSDFTYSPTPGQPTDPFASSGVFSHLATVEADIAGTPTAVAAVTTGTLAATPACGTKTSPTVVNNNQTYTTLTFNGSSAGCYYSVTSPINVSGTMALSGNNVTVIFNGTGNGAANNINQITGSGQNELINAGGNIFNIKNGVSNNGTNAGDLTIGCSATYNNGGCTASDTDVNTFNITGGVSNTQTQLAFGNGTFNIAGGVSTNDCGCKASDGGYDGLFFGNGNVTITGGVTDTDGLLLFGASVSVADNYMISGGISLNNGTACTSPPTNEISFGNGTSFVLTDTGITLDGGCFIFGNDTNHDINSGSRTGSGISNPSGTATLTFGTGTYTINGDFTLDGNSISSGTNMTLVLSGDLTVTAGANVNWSAPATTPPFLIATSSGDSMAISLSGGSSGVLFDGVAYAPNGGANLGGSGAINANPPVTTPPFCFSMVADTITLTGGTSAANTCPGTGATTTMVSLVQ
jgi:Flp pilus assembly protein TadG